jgi:hypothetical protein
MPMPMQPDPNAAPPGGPPPEQGGGQEDPGKALASLLEAMTSLLQGIQDKAPPEAVQALQQAIQAYQQFLDALGGGGGPQGPQPVQQGSDMAGGRA